MADALDLEVDGLEDFFDDMMIVWVVDLEGRAIDLSEIIHKA